MLKFKYAVIALVIASSALLLLLPPKILTFHQTMVAAISVLTICFWATGIIPEFMTSLCFFVVSMLLSLAPAGTIFSGFTSSAVWLIFGGLVLGIGINTTGLGKRVARIIALNLHGRYSGIIAGLVAGGVMFSFVMPSAMGRAVLLTPIASSMAEHFGFSKNTRGRTGVILAVILGSFIPAFAILPANVPNMVLAGMTESQFHISLLYGPYLMLHFPIMGFLKALLITAIIVWLFPDTPSEKNEMDSYKNNNPLSSKEKMLSTVLIVMLILWATDFLHHISPAWIAMAGAVFLMLPGISVVPAKVFNEKMNWASIIFVAGILGLGALINKSGLGHALAGELIKFLPLAPGKDFINFMSVSLAAATTGIFTTLPGIPAVFTPFSEPLARATGFSIENIIMLQVVGFATVFFPYQAPPIVVGMQIADEKFAPALKCCLVLAIITILVLFPLDLMWWKFRGVI